MPDLGIDVLFKGTNMLRLLQGLWVAMKISIVSILISMPLGILVGALMTVKNRFVKAIFRVYLEFIRIQLRHDTDEFQIEPVRQSYLPGLSGIHPYHAAAGAFIYRIFRIYQSTGLESVRRGGIRHRLRPVGHRRDGRSGAWSADQYSEASVRKQ